MPVAPGTFAKKALVALQKEVLKSLGYPVQTNSFYVIIKQMLERVAPVMVDHAGVKQILSYVRDSLLGQGDIDVQIGVTSSAVRGLQLLHVSPLPGRMHQTVDGSGFAPITGETLGAGRSLFLNMRSLKGTEIGFLIY